MFNWRLWLQILLFLLIVAWAGVCIKLSCDLLTKQPGEQRATTATSQTGQYPYDLLGGWQQRSGRDRVFDNGYSSGLLDLIYRTAMRSTNERRRQVEFERRVAAARHFMALAAAAAADDELTARLRLISADNSVPINTQRSIDASELVAADDYNLAHYSERCRKLKANADS